MQTVKILQLVKQKQIIFASVEIPSLLKTSETATTIITLVYK